MAGLVTRTAPGGGAEASTAGASASTGSSTAVPESMVTQGDSYADLYDPSRKKALRDDDDA
jgi:hypothetical protein